jgi:hypothetical protein
VSAGTLRDILVKDRQVRIQDLLIDFDFAAYKSQKEDYEGLHVMDLSSCNSSIIHTTHQRVFTVRVRIETMGSRKGDLAIGKATIALEDDGTETRGQEFLLSTKKGLTLDRKEQSLRGSRFQNEASKRRSTEQENSEDFEDDEDDSGSAAGSNSSGNSG